MEIVNVYDDGVVERAVQVIREGGMVVFPTDTAYGLGVDATNENAVERIYELKERERGKPMHVVVSDEKMAERYVVVNKQARTLIEGFLPGALTLVLTDKGHVCKGIVSVGGTLGIRMPNNNFALKLAESAGVPITATSANKSGDEAPYSTTQVKKSFGEDFGKIDLVIDAGELPRVAPSTLVEADEKAVVILREGPVSREEILAVLG